LKKREEVESREGEARCIGLGIETAASFSALAFLVSLLLSRSALSTDLHSPAPEPHDHGEERAREGESERAEREKREEFLVSRRCVLSIIAAFLENTTAARIFFFLLHFRRNSI